MKRLVCFFLCLALVFPSALAFPAAPEVPAPSVLLMDRASGTVLAEKNADERRSLASVTKIMTLLLTVEAVDNGALALSDMCSVSKAAMSMGGSTAYLGEGEQYTVQEMLKAVTIQSANDGAVVLAEKLAGTEDSFVTKMNERAAQLGMENTRFLNCHGLDAEGHYSSARDIALMSRELLSHPMIRDYTTIWMDTLRGGTFTLSNTNRLIRFYEGATGLKTGSTKVAGACISASAERGGMELIAVVMGAGSGDDRFEAARKLLDFGFANFTTVAAYPEDAPAPVPVLLGKRADVQPVLEKEVKIVVEKAAAGNLVREVTMAQDVEAPVTKGQKLGELTVKSGDEVLAVVPFVAGEDIGRLGWWDVFSDLMRALFMRPKGHQP